MPFLTHIIFVGFYVFISCARGFLTKSPLLYAAHRQLPHAFSSGVLHSDILAWAVKIDPLIVSTAQYDLAADIIARDVGLQNLGRIGSLDGHYLMLHHADERASFLALSRGTRVSTSPRSADALHFMRDSSHFLNVSQHITDVDMSKIADVIHGRFNSHNFVEWHIQQRISPRHKRLLPNDFTSANKESEGHVSRRATPSYMWFNDPLFSKQWHLVNQRHPGMDINVTGVWMHNITGYGVTIAVIDDGLEWTNVDLQPNYNAEGSFDLNSGDSDPMPDSHNASKSNHHGTRCAGEIAAVANNSVCGVGVAYGARLSGIRILDGPMTDALEAAAFTKKYDINDIYSCSWGPQDDGKTVDGPQHVAFAAMRHGVDYGRHGYGAIYVVASGNGGTVGDNCNYDGYANIIYTVTIGAVGEDGRMPYYGEECASMLAVTFSSSSGGYLRSIVTTDWTKGDGTGCTESHSGTSAAAPIAAALIALMLEARPCLTWRDVQHIIVVTAVKVDHDGSQWTRNAAGLYHSHQHGFGLLNAWRLVNTAKVWSSVPWMSIFTSAEIKSELPIPAYGRLSANFTVTDSMLNGYSLNTLEYVHVTVTLSHEHRGDVELVLVCPSGTSSVIGATRKLDDSKDGFQGWTFSTVRCWGEKPTGCWTVIVSDKGFSKTGRGVLHSWILKLYGSPMTSDEFQQRINLVHEAVSGKHLNSNFQLPCPPPLKTEIVEPLSEKMLKVLSLAGAFVIFMAVYETLEYMFCYNEEKREMYKEWSRRRRQQESVPDAGTSRPSPSDTVTEFTRLLDDEEIAMDAFLPSDAAAVDAETSFTSTAIIEMNSSERLEQSRDGTGSINGDLEPLLAS